jgi:hypothetical protein
LKAKKKSQSAALTLQALRAKEARDFRRFARQMDRLPYLKKMDDDQRTALLRELYRLAKHKQILERMTEDVRKDVFKFRKYRRSLVDVERLLRQAMGKIMETATPKIYPRWNLSETLFGGEEVRMAIIRAGEELAKTIEIVGVKQRILAWLVNPQLRTDAENRLVDKESFLVGDLSTTQQIDLEFIREAAARLARYRTEEGKPVPRHDKIIAHIFHFFFRDMMRTDESIRKDLERRRVKGNSSSLGQ